MFGNYFYHELTRKYITLFGTLFNNITIQRKKDDDTIQTIKVPMAYSSQDRMLARLNGDPNLDRPAAAFSPAISFESGQPRYDASRKLQSTLVRCIVSEDGTKTQFVGVPYNISFTLKIYAKNEEDGLRVFEQIIPYFTPSLTVTAQLYDGSDFKMDIPIVLDSTDFDGSGNYGEYPERRQLIWTLNFTMKAEFAGPVSTNNRKLIRIVHVNMNDMKTRQIMEEVHVEPGLTSNGEPTSVRAESIPVLDIKPEDDYGFIVEILEGPTPHA